MKLDNASLKGLIPATVLPLTSSFDVDEPALRRYARWVLSHEGLAGVAVNADTGEGPHLTRDERRRVLSIWTEEVDGRIPIIAGIGGPSTAAAVTGALDAREAAASALLVFPIPAYLGEPLDPELPYAYHKAIEDACGLPIILFQLQTALGGVLFSNRAFDRLLSIQSVIAVKEAGFDPGEFFRVRSILEHADRHVTLLTGNDNFIYDSLKMGAEGALIGFGTLLIDEQIAMIRAALASHWKAAEKHNALIDPLAQVIFSPPIRDYRARTKFALQLMGVLEGCAMRPPLLPLSEVSEMAVRAAVEAIQPPDSRKWALK